MSYVLSEKQLAQIRERNARQLEAQGLTMQITDPGVLAKVARLVKNAATDRVPSVGSQSPAGDRGNNAESAA